MITGITTNTEKRYIKGPGVVYANYDTEYETGTLLGATRGGNDWNPGVTLRAIAVDGAPGRIKGLTTKERVEPTLTVRLLEITKENLIRAIAGAVEESASIVGGAISESTYLDNVALVAENSDGETTVYIVKNALATSVNTINHPDNGEPVLEVTFTGHFDPTDLEDEPWEIIPIVEGS